MEILQITIVIYFLLLQPEDGSKVMYFLQLHSVHVKSQADILLLPVSIFLVQIGGGLRFTGTEVSAVASLSL